MQLDIYYVQIHSKNYVPRKAKTNYNLEQREYMKLSKKLVCHLFAENFVSAKQESNIFNLS